MTTIIESTSNNEEPKSVFYEVVGRRRTVRQFQSKPVEEGKLPRILAAGLKAHPIII